MLNSVLRQFGVSELQVFGLAVLRGQLVSVWESKRECFELIYCSMLKFREAAFFPQITNTSFLIWSKSWGSTSAKDGTEDPLWWVLYITLYLGRCSVQIICYMISVCSFKYQLDNRSEMQNSKWAIFLFDSKFPGPIHLISESAVLCREWVANIVSLCPISIFFLKNIDLSAHLQTMDVLSMALCVLTSCMFSLTC